MSQPSPYEALRARHPASPNDEAPLQWTDLWEVPGLAAWAATQLQAAAAPSRVAKRPAAALKDQAQSLELQEIRAALARAGGNQSEAARLLGMQRSTLISKMKKHGL